MMKRTVLTLAAVAAIAAPVALVAPAAFTPANAQASLNIGLSVPAPAYPMPYVGVAPVGGPVYAYGERWHGWDGGWHRGWERHEWREHERHWDRGRGWDHHRDGHHWR